MKFPNILKNLRISKKLTQGDLAKALGISKSAISMYENGNRKPDIEMIALISDVLDCPIDFLIGADYMYEEDDSITCGEALRQEREKQNISKQEFAKAIGIDVNSLDEYESGDVLMSYYIFKKAVAYLGYDYPDFMQRFVLFQRYNPSQSNDNAKANEAFNGTRDDDAINDCSVVSHHGEVAAASSDVPYDELPPEALKQLEEYKQFLIQKYGKKK